MGVYYNPLEVVQRGTWLITSHRENKPSVQAGEVLVGIMNNGLNVIAPDITRDRDYQAFLQDYLNCKWLGMDIYALPESEVPNCQNTGQKLLQDLEKMLD